jgi:hypothetical protein
MLCAAGSQFDAIGDARNSEPHSSTEPEGDEIASKFMNAREAFQKWLPKGKLPTHHVLGFRVTAVPIGAPIYIDRVFKNRSVVIGVKEFEAQVESQVDRARVKLTPFLPGGLSERPLVRGSRRQASWDLTEGYYDVYCDGIIDLCVKHSWQDTSHDLLFLPWIINHVANVMLAAETFAGVAGVGDAEYGIELELASFAAGGEAPKIPIHGFVDTGHALGTLEQPVVLPRVSFGDKSETLNVILQDLLDACDWTYPPMRLSIKDWRGTE